MSRLILKLSGEALAGEGGRGFDEATCRRVAGQVKTLVRSGHQVGIVIGGGNFWRGRTGTEIDRVKSDQIGMLATVMNCLYVSEIFRGEGMSTEVMTPFVAEGFTSRFSKDSAEEALRQGKVLFFAGGTGHPFFSTDTGVVLRAAELEADCVLLAKNIDGIYDADPATHPQARRYDTLTMEEMIAKNLQAIDQTVAILARDNHIPLRVFALQEEEGIVKAAEGSFHGTTVTA